MSFLYANPLRPLSLDRTAYRNPVLAGDYPDPSVIRVGERDFWATATSTEWAPQFPLFHSTDLVRWTPVGAIFSERPHWSAGRYWAPELSEFEGRFYVYYAGRKKHGPLCIAVATADRPEGPYVDHGPVIGQRHGSIDPMAFTDQRGRRFLAWKEDGNSANLPTTLWVQRLSSDGRRLQGKRTAILGNDAAWEGDIVEAPCIVWHEGWYYLFYSGNACCGKECAYAIGVARAREVEGPYEKYAHNPIAQTNGSWRCPGHGTLVDDGMGRTFLLYHAYDASRDSLSIGRQALLDEVRWRSDGWPEINGGAGPSTLAAAPFGTPPVQEQTAFFDDFSTPTLDAGWQWPHGGKQLIGCGPEQRSLTLTALRSSGETGRIAAVLARSPGWARYEFVAKIELETDDPRIASGVAAYGDAGNAMGLSVGRNTLQLWSRRAGVTRTVWNDVFATTRREVYVKLECRSGSRYRFWFSIDGQRWRAVPRMLHGEFLPPWDRGVRAALTVHGPAGAAGRFEWVRLERVSGFGRRPSPAQAERLIASAS